MLYKFSKEGSKYSLEPEVFFDFESVGMEKNLENMLAQNLSELYSDNGGLMPIFQERQWQSEPDLVAINESGDIVIFELKRSSVHGGTTIQIMKYSQDYALKSYSDLDALYRKYMGSDKKSLREAHKDAFALENALPEEAFNRKHKLIIVGSYADTELIKAVDFWKDRVDIDFIPYRLYSINNQIYFEFFSKPYDNHVFSGAVKGIMFDTNRSYNEMAIWDMISNAKISAYGSVKNMVKSFNKNDFVFYYHKGYGIVAAGRIIDDKIYTAGKDEQYRRVELLTPIIKTIDEIRGISAKEIKKMLGKGFYYANTTKRPYLDEEEAKILLDALMEKYNK